MTEQPPLFGQTDLSSVGELTRPPQVVGDRRGQQQVAVEPRVQLAALVRQRGHGHRVLEQAAQIGMVTAARAGRPAPLRAATRRPRSSSTAAPHNRDRAPRRPGARGIRRARRGPDRRRAEMPPGRLHRRPRARCRRPRSSTRHETARPCPSRGRDRPGQIDPPGHRRHGTRAPQPCRCGHANRVPDTAIRCAW